ncbi:MAG: hypothetical protein UHM85_03430 [Acutalibacteraceae bacterium]|nr:hypothetical protein [Acutalibacteraceae bacterium]
MDDRFRNEGTDGLNGLGNDSYYPGKTPSLGDFSVNIDSKGASDAGQNAKRPQKFEVHIADFGDEPSSNTQPARPSQNNTVRRPVPPTAKSGSLQSRAAARASSLNAG